MASPHDFDLERTLVRCKRQCIAEGLTVCLLSDQTSWVPGMETLNTDATNQRANSRTLFINEHLHMELPLMATRELPPVGSGLPFKPTILKKK